MNRLLLLALAPLLLAAGSAAAQDPHAGHAMAPVPALTPAAVDPHAGHVTVGQTPPARPDPHAGHAMPASAPAQDPHAGHAPAPAPVPVPAPPAVDPHAGHAMPASPAAQDPHAGHDMSAMSPGPPDVPTSADTPGRPAEAPPPAAAASGPDHAADLYFDAAAMAAARERLRVENGGMRTAAAVVDRLEAGFGDGDDTWLWDVQGWVGGDINRFWWKSEGEGVLGDGPEEAELQALYSRAVSPFWDLQAGVRHDVRAGGEDRTHLVLGVQGLAPHWFEVDAAAFLSTEGDLTARVEAEYDQRLTQRLILQPRMEMELAARDIPELAIGAGLSTVELGLRLRYEVRREFAPYLGVEWSRSLGETRDLVEARGGEAADTRVVVGVRAWF